MVDYAKLIEEEDSQKGVTISTADAQWKLEIDMLAFFRPWKSRWEKRWLRQTGS